jgi:FHS family L-fucose permease-like MFS transporter
VGAVLTMGLVMAFDGWMGIGALFACYLFESIMFPTIFALAIRGVGRHTKRASSFLIMSIVGGAIAPVLMGVIGAHRMSLGFVVPLVCFVVVTAYALYLLRRHKQALL